MGFDEVRRGIGGDDGEEKGRMDGCEEGRKTIDDEFNVRLVRLFDTHTMIPLPSQTDPESGIRRRFIADRRIFRSTTCGPVDFSVIIRFVFFLLFRFESSIRNLKD